MMTQIKRQRRTKKEVDLRLYVEKPKGQKPSPSQSFHKVPQGFARVSHDLDTTICTDCYGPLCDHGHLEDCSSCIGPDEQEVEYRIIDGVLYGRRVQDEVRIEVMRMMWEQAVKH